MPGSVMFDSGSDAMSLLCMSFVELFGRIRRISTHIPVADARFLLLFPFLEFPFRLGP